MREPVWIDEYEAVLIHGRLIALYGGPPGIRDEGLLQSALARPRQIYSYEEGPKIVRMAAALTAGIIRNHPFVDGNKRTGFLMGVLFMELNGYRFTASEEDATEAVLSLAAGTLTEDDFAAWLETSVRGPKA